MSTNTDPQKSKPPVYLLLAQFIGIVLWVVFAGFYGIPRLFSIESALGPPLGIVAGILVLAGTIVQARWISMTLNRIFNY